VPGRLIGRTTATFGDVYRCRLVDCTVPAGTAFNAAELHKHVLHHHAMVLSALLAASRLPKVLFKVTSEAKSSSIMP
jgi:hypothetical protein